MQKLGIIGTNWITGQFVQAGQAAGTFDLTAVYSRKMTSGEQFKAQYGSQQTTIYTNLTEFFTQGEFNTVYIASPNSLHYEQAKAALLADKNVIVEKPAFSNPQEMQSIMTILEQKPNCYLFEGARQIHEHNFQVVAAQIEKMRPINGATLTYMKYSSRYDAVLAGEEPNIFSPHFSGGALQDLGVYLVYDALAWFGLPQQVEYTAQMLPTGVDGKGVATLKYSDFDVTLIFGKTVQSYLPSEIYAGKNTIWMDNAGTIGDVAIYQNDGQDVTSIGHAPLSNPMVAEAKVFAEIIDHQDTERYHELLQLSQQVNQVLFQLRHSAGIQFDADQK